MSHPVPPLGLAALLLAGASLEASSRPLFLAAAPGPALSLPGDTPPGVLRLRAVEIDRELLAGAASLELNLFEDAAPILRRFRIERRGPDRFTWFGAPLEGPGLAAITVEGRFVSASIELGERRFAVGALGPDAHAVRELAPIPDTEPTDVVEVAPGSLEPSLAAGTDDGSTLDVLVVYTDWAYAGDPGIEASIQNAIDLMNLSLQNSEVATRVRLVATRRLVGYIEATSMGSDLSRMRDVDGVIDEVHAWRDECQADLVAMIVDGLSYCGIAYLMSSSSVGPGFAPHAFSVTSRHCLPNHTFAHELGHNLGIHHDWGQTSAGGAFPYSKGHYDTNRRFRTILSYDCPGGCSRVAHYSNPDVSYAGAPTGIAAGQPRAANAASSLNRTRAVSAQFRDSTLGCCLADAFEAGDACSRKSAALLPGEVQTRNFCEGTEDWLQFRACAGRTYTLETLSLGTLADTVLEVFASDCTTLLASDDDGAGNRASRILFTPARAGDYRVRIRQKAGNAGSGKSYDVTLLGDGSACDVCGDGLCEGAVGEGCATCVVDCPPCAPALPLWLAKGVGSELRIQVENVANETGYTVYDGFVPQMWNGGVRRSCVPLWQDLGVRAELSLTVPFKSRWFVVAAANAAGESSCGLDDLGQELNQRPNWPLTAPCP